MQKIKIYFLKNFIFVFFLGPFQIKFGSFFGGEYDSWLIFSMRVTLLLFFYCTSSLGPVDFFFFLRSVWVWTISTFCCRSGIVPKKCRCALEVNHVLFLLNLWEPLSYCHPVISISILLHFIFILFFDWEY